MVLVIILEVFGLHSYGPKRFVGLRLVCLT